MCGLRRMAQTRRRLDELFVSGRGKFGGWKLQGTPGLMLLGNGPLDFNLFVEVKGPVFRTEPTKSFKKEETLVAVGSTATKQGTLENLKETLGNLG